MGNNKKVYCLYIFFNFFYFTVMRAQFGRSLGLIEIWINFGELFVRRLSYNLAKQDKQKSPQASAAGTHSTWSKIKIHRGHESSVNSICSLHTLTDCTWPVPVPMAKFQFYPKQKAKNGKFKLFRRTILVLQFGLPGALRLFLQTCWHWISMRWTRSRFLVVLK